PVVDGDRGPYRGRGLTLSRALWAAPLMSSRWDDVAARITGMASGSSSRTRGPQSARASRAAARTRPGRIPSSASLTRASTAGQELPDRRNGTPGPGAGQTKDCHDEDLVCPVPGGEALGQGVHHLGAGAGQQQADEGRSGTGLLFEVAGPEEFDQGRAQGIPL